MQQQLEQKSSPDIEQQLARPHWVRWGLNGFRPGNTWDATLFWIRLVALMSYLTPRAVEAARHEITGIIETRFLFSCRKWQGIINSCLI